ncbi:MAG: hypothetical protein ABI716_01065 [Candidatus Saccharibacteria bacterium]
MNPNNLAPDDSHNPVIEQPQVPQANVTSNTIAPAEAAVSSFPQPPVAQVLSSLQSNKIWSKSIPKTNKIFLIAAAALLLIVDLPLLISDRTGMLIMFFILMLIAFAVLLVFSRLELYVFKKKFSGSKSKYDHVLFGLIIARDLLLFLNFIPYVQLLGIFAFVMLGLPILISYTVLVSLRSSSSTSLA